MHVQEEGMPVDYFISYASPDRSWAEWIGWVLEETGATVVLQAWDFRAGSNFVLEMQRAAAAARRTIAVLSPAYLESHFAAPEWAAAFAQDPEGLQSKLVPVRVQECAPDGMLKALVFVDLVGLDAQEACRQLLDRLNAKRGKPDRAPAFPGPSKPAQAQPPFPGPRSVSGAELTRPAPYIPKIRGAISDLDRARFVKEAFATIRDHFQQGLDALAAEPAIDSDMTRRSEVEFVAEVFVTGKRKARCRIWLGGVMGGRDQIGYYEGDYDVGNSMNEALSIADERDGLALTALMNMGLGAGRLPPGLDPRRMAADEAAEYLWRRFLWRLE
jgi:TIR domain